MTEANRHVEIMLPDQKFRVFISSTIGELQAERQAVIRAIRDLGMEPVYFEHGANSHSAQETYRSWLRQSDAFLAIYAKSYGWVGPGMTISGLEDEYLLAQQKHRLYYVKNFPEQDRHPRLREMIQWVGNHYKYQPFSTPEELAEHVKRDLMVMLTSMILGYRQPDEPPAARPTQDPAVPPAVPTEVARRFVDRPDVTNTLKATLVRDHQAVLTGPMGSGKTHLLKHLQVTEGGVYLSVALKTPLQALNQLVTLVSAQRGQPSQFTADEGAAWAMLQSLVLNQPTLLLIDHCGFAPEVVQGLANLEMGSGGIVFCTNTNDHPAIRRLRTILVPAFTEHQTLEFLEKAGKVLPPGAFQQLYRVSGGLPLYLEYYVQSDLQEAPDTLLEAEDSMWLNLPGEVQEALRFVALSRMPLTPPQILELLQQRGVETINMRSLVEQSQGTLLLQQGTAGIFHPHFSSFIQTRAREEGREQEYHQALAELALEEDLPIAIAHHLSAAGDERRFEHLAEAAHMAFFMGDFDAALAFNKMLLEHQKAIGDLQGEGHTALQLATLEDMKGNRQEALTAVQRAKHAFNESGLSDGVLAAECFLFAVKFSLGEIEESIEGLKGLRAQLLERSPVPSILLANVCLNLSYVYQRTGQFRLGVAAAEEAVEHANQVGAEHAAMTASMNLVGCLAQLSDLDEAEARVEVLEEVAARNGWKRLVAAVHNLRTMIYRKRDQPERAEHQARLAVQISQELGLTRLTTINLSSLGNALVDQDRYEEAEAAYQESLELAQRTGDELGVAHNQELLARVRMDQGRWEEALSLSMESYQVSVQHQERLRVATSSEKLAKLHARLGQWEDAAHYFEVSASHFADIDRDDAFNNWRQCGFVASELPDLHRVLRSCIQAALLEKPIERVDVDALTQDWKTTWMYLKENHLEGHQGLLFARVFVHWCVVNGRHDWVEEFVDVLLTELQPATPVVLHALARTLLEADVSEAKLAQLEQAIPEAVGDALFSAREKANGCWTVGLATPKPVVVQVDMLSDVPSMRRIALAMVLWMVLTQEVLGEVQQSLPGTDTSEIQVMLVEHIDQKEHIPQLELEERMQDESIVQVSLGEQLQLALLVFRDGLSTSSSAMRLNSEFQAALAVRVATVLFQASGLPDDHGAAFKKLCRGMLA